MDKYLIADLQKELIRIDNNEIAEENNINYINKRIFASSEDSNQALQNVKKILKIIIETILTQNKWIDYTEWLNVFPSEFIEKFAPEMSDSEAQAWLKKWEKMTMEERAEEEKNKKWALSDWLYWFEPEERSWKWWKSDIVDNNNFIIEIISDQEVIPIGALEWLLKISNATITEDQ